MRLLLWHRLFIASLLLCATVLAIFVGWQQYQFRSGFRSYLQAVALERAQRSATRLADAYALQGNWDFLRHNEGLFGNLTDPDRALPGAQTPDQQGSRPLPERAARSQSQDAFEDRRPAPPDRFGRDHGPRPGAPSGPGSGGPEHWSRLLLVDAAGRKVAGLPGIDRSGPRVPVTLGSEPIGALYLPAMPAPSAGPEQAFAQTQKQAAWIAALVLFAAALLISLLTARHLLQPVQALSTSVAAVTRGDYTARIDAPGDDELGRLAQGVNQMTQTLDQHREARQQWGTDIAHELRTPITILRAEIQALLDGLRQPTRKAFDSLLVEAERLSRLVEDLYQLSLMDAEALDYVFEPVDLVALVQRSADSIRSALSGAGLSIELNLPERLDIDADPVRLSQLLDNLLTNCRRYTEAPGHIRIAVREYDGQVHIMIDDSAPGVAVEHRPRLFDRLFRVEVSRSRAHGGAGLGLSICAAIVQAHHGRIEADASELGGLCVRIALPLRQD